MNDTDPHGDAIIIPFPLARIRGPRLTAKNRDDLQAWEAQAGTRGYAQVTICGNDVAMICWRGVLWTLHVGTKDGQRFELARHGLPGAAHFANLDDALSALDGPLDNPGSFGQTPFAAQARP
jgi:hypothetical protein